jgi:NodT family efflux transporter outer membrane factor (OMF) lipoprotein
MMRLRLSLLVCACSLWGCAAGPDYTPPEVDAPAQFVSQEVLEALAAGAGEGAVSADWWQGFDDPLLDRVVAEAMAENYAIGAAHARVKAAEAQVLLVDSQNALRTTASVEASGEERQGLGNNSNEGSDSDITGLLGLALPLDVFGRYQRRDEAAQAELEAARAALRGAVLDVSTDVAREYLQLRGNQRQLSLLEESVELQKKTLSIVSSRYESGLSPELDLKRAEAAVASLEADIPPLRESLTRARNSLATLAGQFPGAYEALLQQREEIPEFTGQVPAVVPGDVLRMRPDVNEAEAELKQAIANIGVAEAEWLPAFSLAGQLRIGSAGGSGAGLDLLTAALQAIIQQVVTDGGARRANVRIASAQAEEALADYRQTLIEAIEEVEAALAALASSRARQEALERAVDASSRSFFQAESLYRQGLTSFLDVVDVQRSLASTQQQLASARTVYAAQVANLFRALGTAIDAPQRTEAQ